MNRAGLACVIMAGILPAACGGDAPRAVEGWRPTGSAHEIALADCDDQVDTRMQLHGFPKRPSADTPQYRYRLAYMDKCMRDKGYAPD